MSLSVRQQQVLHVLVDEYIHHAVPVASESVAHKMPTPVSPATVRNELAALEEEGYVLRPHTSAGGVPSDKAYRAYVESLGEVSEPSRQVKQLIKRSLPSSPMDVEARNRAAVRLLAELVHVMAVATVPIASNARWKHVDLVHLQGLVALLIVVLEGSARLKQQQVLLREPMTQDQLTQLANKLNAKLAGLSTEEVQARSGDLSALEQEFVGLALAFMRQEERTANTEHFVDGLRHILTYPELAEGTKARALAEVLEYQQLVKTLLENMPGRGVVRVTIGTENKEDLLRPFTIVFARYGTDSGGDGVLGVLGPTRLEYATAISNVRYLAARMGDIAEGGS